MSVQPANNIKRKKKSKTTSTANKSKTSAKVASTHRNILIRELLRDVVGFVITMAVCVALICWAWGPSLDVWWLVADISLVTIGAAIYEWERITGRWL